MNIQFQGCLPKLDQAIASDYIASLQQANVPVTELTTSERGYGRGSRYEEEWVVTGQDALELDALRDSVKKNSAGTPSEKGLQMLNKLVAKLTGTDESFFVK